MANPSTDKLAVLIDADNPSGEIAADLLAEVARYGTATVKRAYGDWTTPNLAKWKDALLSLAIQPIQQFRFTVGKNATDSALIIDAMDLLHSGSVDGFCLFSSDSDFTRLATRIREAGLAVYGFGERKTPRPFVAACDKFVYVELFSTSSPDVATSLPQALPTSVASIRRELEHAVSLAARDEGWAALSAVGSLLAMADPSFDPRTYGFPKLGELVRSQSYLEVKSMPASDGSPNSHLYVRRREA